MKQNERLLVYAVTGFLAVILLVAVLFGPSGREAAAKVSGDTANGAKNDGPRALGDLLGDGKVAEPPAPKTDAAKSGTNGAAPAGSPTGTVTDVLQPNPVTAQQPLVASERPLLAMDMVAQQIGASRRDRTVRMVRAKSGDSLDSLVRRWCGARDPFLDEAKALNEDLVTLRVGQEVCVPWVDDEVVLAAYEASKPKTLVPAPMVTDPNPPTATPPRPTFAEPGAGRTDAGQPITPRDGVTKPVNTPAATVSGTEYVVKSGESLWKIADRTYGRQNAPKMVNEIKKANPSIGETLRAGQKIVLPAAPQ